MSKENELSGPPNEKYVKYFEKFSEINSMPIEQWKVPQILSYFCKKYKEQYGSDYQFKYNSPAPSKCFEVFQIKRLASLLSSDPNILKNYIDWVYETRVQEAKRKLTSISFMTAEPLIVDYKMKFLFNQNNVERNTNLPDKYKPLLAGLYINTYGDLALIMQMEDKSNALIAKLDEMKSMGFDFEILKKVI